MRAPTHSRQLQTESWSQGSTVLRGLLGASAVHPLQCLPGSSSLKGHVGNTDSPFFPWTHPQPPALPRYTCLVTIKFLIIVYSQPGKGLGPRKRESGYNWISFTIFIIYFMTMNALVCRCQAKSRILMPRPLWLPKPGSRGHVLGSEVRAEGEKRGEGKTRDASHLGLCKAEEPANHHIWHGHQRLLFCLPKYKRDLCLLQHGLLALGSPPPRARLLLPTMSGTC